ncbi:MAG: hypothetical protein H7A45_01460 [Verrucomicrobiales bacterium]|nr:hypothetical protein [Verrucomicrobiales bacterium]
MNLALELLRGPDVARLGWTLVHFLWQGALLGAAFTAVRGSLRTTSPNVRYLAGCLTLFLMAACVVGTFVTLEPTGHLSPFVLALRESVSASADSPQVQPVSPSLQASPEVDGQGNSVWNAVEAALPWVVAAWAAGVGVCSLRLAGGWIRVRQSRRGLSLAADDPLGARFVELRERLRVSRRVRLMKSALVRVPTVVGWFRPLILLPASTVSGLSPVQLDLILAHELAHLRRWDHWVNLGQLLLETVLFYHPAVWWVSRCVREDREHCCDEIAVTVCGNRLALAQALTTLEELRQANGPFALAATDGSLLARVRRILALPDDERGGIDRRAAGSTLLLLGLLVFATGKVLHTSSPRLYTAVARIQLTAAISPVDVPPSDAGMFTGASEAVDASLFRSAPDQVRFPNVLMEVIRRGSHHGQTNAPPSQQELPLFRRLHDQVWVRHIPQTCLMEVEVRDTDMHDATTLAQTVAEEYVRQLRSAQRARTLSGMDTLLKQVSQQDMLVRAQQRELVYLLDQLGIPGAPVGDDEAYRMLAERELLGALRQTLLQSSNELAFWSEKLNALEEMGAGDRRQLRDTILTVMPGEDLLSARLDDLDRTEQDLARLRSRFSPDHPEVKEVLALQTVLQVQASNRVEAVMRGLRANVEACETKCASVSNQIENTTQAVRAKAEVFQRYLAAKRALEPMLRVHETLALRLHQEQIDADLDLRTAPQPTVVDAARPVRGPWRRWEPYDVWLMGCGCILSLGGLGIRLRGRSRDGDVSTARAP